jgi:hypothetical protein
MPNKPLDMDKIRITHTCMGDKYWNDISIRCSTLSKETARITGEFSKALSKLTVIRMNILEAKYNGYQLLLENNKKPAVKKIVKENKETINKLLQDKQEIVTTLLGLLVECNTLVNSVQTLGEPVVIEQPQGEG